MLRSIEELERYGMQASDGDIGRVTDLYFDDRSWVIRYLVVDTGSWLRQQKLLISPFGTAPPDWARKILTLTLTRDEVEGNADHCNAKPIARQIRVGYIGPPGFPYQTAGPGSWSMGDRFSPTRDAPRSSAAQPGPVRGGGVPEGFRGGRYAADRSDPHLRSCNSLRGCNIRALDGEIGRVQGMLVEEETWTVRFLVVKTSADRPGMTVLIAPPWIVDADWSAASIRVDLSREQVRDSAPYPVVESRDEQRVTARHEH